MIKSRMIKLTVTDKSDVTDTDIVID
jgi:hypothetical protein